MLLHGVLIYTMCGWLAAGLYPVALVVHVADLARLKVGVHLGIKGKAEVKRHFSTAARPRVYIYI